MKQETKTFEAEAECGDCSGTGLYQGMAEKVGFAVVCHRCKGTGKTKIVITYKTFVGRKDKEGIKRVLQTNPGICVGMGKSKVGDKDFTHESFGGISYEDWKNGKKFGRGTEMREFSCPAWWYQCADYDKKPKWEECIACGTFGDCKDFETKEKCWQRWDKEN